MRLEELEEGDRRDRMAVDLSEPLPRHWAAAAERALREHLTLDGGRPVVSGRG